jgi:hypothetical protein
LKPSQEASRVDLRLLSLLTREAAMTQTTHPEKEKVRAFMSDRTRKESPPPALEEIRRTLGWDLLPNNGPVPEVPD